MNQGLENAKDTMLMYCCPARDIGEGKGRGICFLELSLVRRMLISLYSEGLSLLRASG